LPTELDTLLDTLPCRNNERVATQMGDDF